MTIEAIRIVEVGIQGPPGPAGAAGATGTSLLAGSGPPSSGLGNPGDWYLDTATYELYGPKDLDDVTWPGPTPLSTSDHGLLLGLGDNDHPQYQLVAEKGVAGGYASLDGGGTVPDAQIPAAIARDAEVTAAFAAHLAAADPHPVYLTVAEGAVSYDPLGSAAAAIVAHVAAVDPHPTYTTASEASVIAAATVAVHEALADPHPTYTTAAEASALDAAAIAAHVAAVDPHPTYLTAAEGAAAFDALGAAAAAVAAHAALADPHTGYRLESDDHSHQSTGLQGGQLDHGLALTGLGDDDHPQYVLHTEVDDVAVNGATTDPISSNWAFDHMADAAAHAAAFAAHVALADPHPQYAVANPAQSSEFFHEFYQASGPLVFHNNGAASGNTANTAVTTTRPGVVTNDTGTATSGQAGWNGGAILFGGGTWTFDCGVVTPASLSDGTVNYTMRVGFLDVFPGAPTDGAYFRHENGQANWRCVTRSNSVETVSDSGVVVAVSTYYRLRVEVNAAATSVGFYINDTLVATNVANIPSGASRDTAFGAHVAKNATGSGGGTNRAMQTDYVRVKGTLTAARS